MGAPAFEKQAPLADLYGVSTDSLLGAGEDASDLTEAIASLDGYHTGTTRERYERCRALLRKHPNDSLLPARIYGEGVGDLARAEREIACRMVVTPAPASTV